mmetsp:Transcript_17666/g.53421  ORF Transcript_17666/g.53421 Transcript_17666/m.53421 type:complete len:86 (-) Transcript_17666:111-368(-)|eukprot:scaffold240919_cov39-Tisochrysis_lutea.AAC.1
MQTGARPTHKRMEPMLDGAWYSDNEAGASAFSPSDHSGIPERAQVVHMTRLRTHCASIACCLSTEDCYKSGQCNGIYLHLLVHHW